MDFLVSWFFSPFLVESFPLDESTFVVKGGRKGEFPPALLDFLLNLGAVFGYRLE